MATKNKQPKVKPASDEVLSNVDFNLFDALAAIDRKDYGWFDKLSEEQQNKFSAYMMLHWTSAISGNDAAAAYYVLSTEYHANIHMFNPVVANHPKLQWLMLCASSPSIGKQFHKWIPHIPSKVLQLDTPVKSKEMIDYYTKIHPQKTSSDIKQLADNFSEGHKYKCDLAKIYPTMKLSDIEILSKITSHEDYAQYQRDCGN